MKFAPRRPPAALKLLAAVAPLIVWATLTGCGGSAPPPPSDSADRPANDAGSPDTGAAAATAPPAAGLAPFTDPAGRKWLNKTIPYDAFATAPRSPGGTGSGTTVAAATPRRGAGLLSGIGAGSPTTGSSMTGTPAPTAGMGSRGAMPTVGMGAGMGGGAVGEEEEEDMSGWGAVISAEDLRDEIKRSRNVMAAAVGTVAAFNRMREELPGEAATLAAMAQITADHPGRVPWKDYADAVRTLAVRVGEASSSRGRSARDEARASFDPLDSILGGNPPPDNAVAEFDRVLDADRATLMHRMETALKYLQQEAPDAAAMADNGGDLARQAAVLGALSRFTAHEAYDNASEADYQQWANDLTAAARDAAAAARETKDYTAYRAAVDRAAATCSACHRAYRF